MVYRVPVTGVVELGLAPFVERSLREAEAAGAAAVVLDIDTPGGRVDAAERIADAVRDAKVPVYAYVNRRALSAGALIALSTRGVFMRPGAVLGAATPVTGEGRKASEKVVSAMRSEFRALAEQRGLDPRVAEAMVDEDVAIPGVVEGGKLLTLSTADAQRLGYATPVADWDALLGGLSAPGAAAVETRVNWAERLVRFLSNPLVSPFLLSLGFLGLLIEIKTPSFGLAGMAGLGSLGLFFGSHLVAGARRLGGDNPPPARHRPAARGAARHPRLRRRGRPRHRGDRPQHLPQPGGPRAHRGGYHDRAPGDGHRAAHRGFRRLAADQAPARTTGGSARLLNRSAMSRELGFAASRRRDDLLGLEGVTLTALRPAGTARFGEERLDVVSAGDWVDAGAPVRIVGADGYRHVVEVV